MNDMNTRVQEFYRLHDEMMQLRSQDDISPRDWEHITDVMEDIIAIALLIVETKWPRDTASDKPALRGPQIDEAVAIVAAWLGNRMGYKRPAPVGKKFAYRGEGPMLVPDYEGLWHPQDPTPALILEGGPEDWAVYAASECQNDLKEIGVFAEPLASFILQFFPYPTWNLVPD